MTDQVKAKILRNVFIPAGLAAGMAAAPFVAEANEADSAVHRYIDFNILSVHDPFKREMTHYWEHGERKHFNERNWGIGYTQLHDLSHPAAGTFRLGGTAGYYLNSYNGDSFYIGGVAEQGYKLSEKWEVAGGAMLGGITGYKHISGLDVTPAGQLYIRGEYNDKVSVKVGVIPEFGINDKKNPTLITLQVGYKF